MGDPHPGAGKSILLGPQTWNLGELIRVTKQMAQTQAERVHGKQGRDKEDYSGLRSG